MTEDKIKIEELVEQVMVSSGKDDICIICYKDQEERCKELFPSKEIYVLQKKVSCKETNNAIFIIPTDVKSIKVVYEDNTPLDIELDIEVNGTIYTIY